jgi:O-antigen/teichoic acid export membrane protein
MFLRGNQQPGFFDKILVGSFFWTLGGSIAFAGSQWALVVVLAKVSTPAIVGAYSFATAVAYPLYLFANLALRQVYVNDREGRYSFGNFLALRYVLVGVVCAALLSIAAFLNGRGESGSLFLIVGFAMLLDSISESYYSVLQKNEQMNRIGRSQLYRSCLGLALALVTLFYTHNVVLAVSGLLLAKLIIVMIYDSAPKTFQLGWIGANGSHEIVDARDLRRRFRPEWNLRTQRQMFWTALPLGTVAVLVSLTANIPRYVIEHFLGARDLGIYSALNYVPQTGMLISSALGYVTYARLGKLYFERDIEGFKKLLATSVVICITIGLGGLFVSATFGKAALTMLYRPEYAVHWRLLVWLTASAALAFVTSCFTFAITAASQFRQQIPLFVVVVSVSALGSYLLVPKIGLYGGAVATCISITSQLAGTILILQRALAKRRAGTAENGSSSAMIADTVVSES